MLPRIGSAARRLASPGKATHIAATRARVCHTAIVPTSWHPNLLPGNVSRSWRVVAPGAVISPAPLVQDAIASGGRLLARYRFLAKSRPYATGFATCFAKGIIADILAQKVIARRKEVDRRQTLAMGVFSGCFCGCAYHFIFNKAFPAVFGASKELGVVLSQAAADMSIVFPLLYMPTFYLFDELCRSGSLGGIPARWRAEIGNSMRQYVKVWPATMICVFTVVPVELRVAFIATVSFSWLIALSVMTH